MHFFVDHSQLTEQNIAHSFGINTVKPNLFKITSEFQLTAKAKTFACQNGMMIVQQSVADTDLVNIILKPAKGLKIHLSPVKYYIYRGISKDSLFVNNQIIPKTQAPENSLLERFWKEVEDFRNDFNLPNHPDPTPKDFGYDNDLPDTLEIEKIFDHSQSETFPIYVKEGEWIADFANNRKIGFEIILETDKLENPSFGNQINLGYLRKENHSIDVSGLSGFEKRAKQELVLAYLDPAAFFGSHYDVGVSISVFSGNTKTFQNKKQSELYSDLLDKFYNKNKIYLDIRSENGYSYNFYQNYGDGNGENIKIENTASEYGTSTFPILILDSPDKDKINLNLRIDDNLKPILFSENRKIFDNHNSSCFLDETKLLNENDTDWSKDISLNFPVINGKNVAYYAKLFYYRQENSNIVHRSANSENQSTFDTIFASLDSPNLGNDEYEFQHSFSSSFSFIKGELPNAQTFSGIAETGANFDENRIVFHTRMHIPNETTGEFYAEMETGIGNGLNLEGNFNQMSFLKRNVNYSMRIIKEDANAEPVKILDILSYKGYPGRKEELFILGLMQSELEELKNVTGLSDKHARYIGFEDITPDPAIDIDGKPYQKYKVNVQGLDDNGEVAVVYPTADIFVYANSVCIFCSKSFSANEEFEGIDSEYIYYTNEGYYLGGNPICNNVYLSTQEEYDIAKTDKKWSLINKEDNLLKENKIAISHLKFVQKASIVYGESSAGYNIVEKYEFYAIASVNMRNKVAFGISSELAINFRNTSALKRNNNVAMKFSTAAVINALLGGTDYSNGAKQWDGAEQTHLPTNNPDILSNGRFMFKVNVMGWKINDEHFTSWKNAVNGKFGVNYFNAPQMKYAVANYGGMKNKDKIRLQSVAQYGLTMFWKEVNIIKP